MITIVVYGTPAPQGSKRFVGHAKNGRGLMIESSKKVKPWREAVKWAAIGRPVSMRGMLLGAVHVDMTFTVAKPMSAPKRKASYPDRKPDLSKLIRSTEDALTDAGVWEDDARVISCMARKVYPNEGIDSMESPGAIIRIWQSGTIEQKS